LRTRRPAAHRWIGRAYLALMSISMLTAMVFLIVSMPVNHFGGRAFDLQLWALALGTLASAWYALIAIRSRDLIAHRAWMGYSIALMMTAPLLRVVWIGVQPLIPQAELLDNLGAGAVLLGVAAPFGAAVAFMLTQRGRPTAGARPVPPSAYGGLLALLAVGSAGYGVLFARLPADIPSVFVWFHLLPAWLASAITLLGARAARATGDPTRERRWTWLFAGVAAAPTAASITALIASPGYGAVNAFTAGGMVGATLPITLSFAIVVHIAATRRGATTTSLPPQPVSQRL